jgi:hypothetical protein
MKAVVVAITMGQHIKQYLVQLLRANHANTDFALLELIQ